MSETPTPAAETDDAFGDDARSQDRLADEDFYMDGPYLVFTAEYHRKRGYCCGSGCRHCPYGDAVSDLAE